MTSSQFSAALEAGTIINKHYNVEDYVRRRVGYFAKHPDYSHLPKLFPIVRRNAGEIFAFEQEELSVQEVRRRKQAAEFEVLLPLPTSENTATIDGFSSYGVRE